MQTLKNYVLKINDTMFLEDNQSSSINAFVILKPGFLKYKDEWQKMIKNRGWQVLQEKRYHMSIDEAKQLYVMHKDKGFYNDLVKYMSSDDCIIMICHKNCQDPIKDMDSIKKKFRDAYGESEMKNGMHSSDSLDNVIREAKIFRLL